MAVAQVCQDGAFDGFQKAMPGRRAGRRIRNSCVPDDISQRLGFRVSIARPFTFSTFVGKILLINRCTMRASIVKQPLCED